MVDDLMEPTAHTLSNGKAAAAGASAVAVAFGVSELLAGILGTPSLIQGIADWVVDSVPPGLKQWAISTFGTGDKPVLLVGIVAVGLLLGAVVGFLARARVEPILIAFGGFGILAALAAGSNPAAGTTGPWLMALVAVVGGVVAFNVLRRPPASVTGDRRLFLKAVSLTGLGLVFAGIGRLLFSAGREAASGRADVTLAATPTTIAASNVSFEIEGLTPVVVPNRDFYRIDTAIAVPRVELDTWKLTFSGMIDKPFQINFDQLMDLPMVERYVTLSCVSNEVGGDLVGNALWVGVPLSDLLDRAGVATGAEQLVARAVDGFTVGFPVEAAYDGREALVAVGMNGEALPLEHGFPVRLVVAGLYGYVSATKWLSEIELTTWDGFDAYWVPRGWAKEAPIKTQSRIDTPRGTISPGERYVAGVAWAPNTGIELVEVQVDDEEWQTAELSEPLSKDAWRQWRVAHTFTAGRHRIRVRATDSDGMTQRETRVAPAPDGAEGWHTTAVVVR